MLLPLVITKFDSVARDLIKNFPSEWSAWSSYPFDLLAFDVHVITCFHGGAAAETRARAASSSAGGAAAAAAASSGAAAGSVGTFVMPDF